MSGVKGPQGYRDLAMQIVEREGLDKLSMDALDQRINSKEFRSSRLLAKGEDAAKDLQPKEDPVKDIDQPQNKKKGQTITI